MHSVLVFMVAVFNCIFVRKQELVGSQASYCSTGKVVQVGCDPTTSAFYCDFSTVLQWVRFCFDALLH